jgi:hypothetical protein
VIARARTSALLLTLAVVLPRAVIAAEAAEVTCKDGTKSHAGKGACSGHGGVDKSASKPSEPAAATENKSTTTKSTSKSKSKDTKTETESDGPKKTSSKSSEVTCKDGTTSHAGKGACSGHGGVDKGQGAAPTATSAAPAPAPPASTAAPVSTAAPAPAAPVTSASHPKSSAGDKGPPTAKCKDGSLSYAQHHTGACSNHGGVAEWLDATPK